ncbi:MAG: hypothetical protein FJ255_07325 [Phycisphaerae bacterium]|nr:hypothetical protein [Phycisphaerae bacterium]
MSQTRAWIAVEIDARRFSALGAVVSPAGVDVRAWCSAPRPEDVPADDAEAMGAWAARELDAAGIRRAPALVCVPRSDVVLKTISLPRGDAGQIAPAELLAMVRLQMSRQLTVMAEGAPIDFADLSARAAGGDPSQQHVLAAALPADRMAWMRRWCDAAGLKLAGTGLRSVGAAGLAVGVASRSAGSALVVTLGPSAVEFGVVCDACLTSARAADLPRPTSREQAEGFIERVLVEARRTAMALKPGPAGLDVAVVVGDDPLSHAVATRLGEALGAPASTVGLPPTVGAPASMPDDVRAALAPLFGLLADRAVARATVDFVNPRRAPDRRARIRQLGLAALFALIVLGGAAYLVADRRLAALDREIAALAEQHRTLSGEYARHLLDHARLSHAEAWTSGRVDWIAHLRRVSDLAPDPGQGKFEALSGVLRSNPVYTPRARGARYPDGAWSALPQITFDMAGKVASRAIAAGFRGRLVADASYRVESGSPDVDDRFDLTAISSSPRPVAPAETAPANPEGGP